MQDEGFVSQLAAKARLTTYHVDYQVFVVRPCNTDNNIPKVLQT
jgi:hypothetical protein